MGELENIQMEEARWTFCLAFYNWKELGASQDSLLKVAEGMRYGFGEAQIREMMLYLSELGLCVLETLPDGKLWGKRTAKLTDLVEYNAECPPSIARPKQKYW